MKNIVVDVGNSSAKVGIFTNHDLESEKVFIAMEDLYEFVREATTDAILFSSVRKNEEALISYSHRITKSFIMSPYLPLPIVNKYATPTTLGMDRLAAVCGAKALFPLEDCLVIDTGSCVTFDLIDEASNYLGGAISPGLSMRVKAMHSFTERLPLVEIEKDIQLIGNSTVTCLQSGALNGMRAEIEGIIARYREHYPKIRVILCGGDTHFFENSLKGAIFAVQNLVLRGLNSILIHNVSQ